jgi:hypothetical protein
MPNLYDLIESRHGTKLAISADIAGVVDIVMALAVFADDVVDHYSRLRDRTRTPHHPSPIIIMTYQMAARYAARKMGKVCKYHTGIVAELASEFNMCTSLRTARRLMTTMQLYFHLRDIFGVDLRGAIMGMCVHEQDTVSSAEIMYYSLKKSKVQMVMEACWTHVYQMRGREPTKQEIEIIKLYIDPSVSFTISPTIYQRYWSFIKYARAVRLIK